MGVSTSKNSIIRRMHSKEVLTKNEGHEGPQSLSLQNQDLKISCNGGKVFIDKLQELRPQDQARSICYIPERNLLVALVWNGPGSILYIYSTMKNFNLIATRKPSYRIDTISYSKEMKKILAGGDYLQVWDPRSFSVEIQVESHTERCESQEIPEANKLVSFITYVASSDVIVTKEGDLICVYDRNLEYLSKHRLRTEIEKDLGLPWFMRPNPKNSVPLREEIVGVSKDLLLGVNHSRPQQVFLVNLRKQTLREYPHIFIPTTSCVVMTEETAKKKVFTCLTGSLQDFSGKFKLTQFSINLKTEKLTVAPTATNLALGRLQRLENSRYFIAQNNASESFLLAVNKDKVETVKIFSKKEYDFGRYLLSNCILLKDDLLVLIERKKIKVHKLERLQEEQKILKHCCEKKGLE